MLEHWTVSYILTIITE